MFLFLRRCARGASKQVAWHREGSDVIQDEHGRVGAHQPGRAGGDDLREPPLSLQHGDAPSRLRAAPHVSCGGRSVVTALCRIGTRIFTHTRCH